MMFLFIRLMTMSFLVPTATWALPQSKAFRPDTRLHRASFDETYNRYPSPYGVIAQFQRIFPFLSDYAKYSDCLKVDEKAAPVVGAIDPLQGGALEKEPGALFYQFYQDCVHELANSLFTDQQVAVANAKIILGPEVQTLLMKKLMAIDCTTEHPLKSLCSYPSESTREGVFWYYIRFSDLDVETQRMLVRQFIEFLVGPEAMLEAYGYVGPSNIFSTPLKKKDDLVDFVLKTIEPLPSKKQPGGKLTVHEAYAEIAILLRLGPALKD